jgi:hypothetical protein
MLVITHKSFVKLDARLAYDSPATRQGGI